MSATTQECGHAGLQMQCSSADCLCFWSPAHLSRILVWTSCLTAGGSLSTACWNVNTHWAALSWLGSNSSTWLVILFRYVGVQVRSDSLTFDTFKINNFYVYLFYIGMGSAHISFGIMSLKQILGKMYTLYSLCLFQFYYLFPLNEECAIISNVVSTIVKILQVFVHGSEHLL